MRLIICKTPYFSNGRVWKKLEIIFLVKEKSPRLTVKRELFEEVVVF